MPENNKPKYSLSKKSIIGASASALVVAGVTTGTIVYLNQDEKPVLPSGTANSEENPGNEDSSTEITDDNLETSLEEKDEEEMDIDLEGEVDLRDQINEIIQGETALEERENIDLTEQATGDRELNTILEAKTQGIASNSPLNTVDSQATEHVNQGLAGTSTLEDIRQQVSNSVGTSSKVASASTNNSSKGSTTGSNNTSNGGSNAGVSDSVTKPNKPNDNNGNTGNSGSDNNKGNAGNKGNNGSNGGNSDNKGGNTGDNGGSTGSNGGDNKPKPNPKPEEPKEPEVPVNPEEPTNPGDNDNGNEKPSKPTDPSDEDDNNTEEPTNPGEDNGSDDGDNDSEEDNGSDDGDNDSEEDNGSDDGDNDSEEDNGSDDGDNDSEEDNGSDDGDNDSEEDNGSDDGDNDSEEDNGSDEDDDSEKEPIEPSPINQVPTINGVENIVLEYGAEFDALEGITAVDKEDGDLTDKITVNKEIDTTKAGEYTLIYRVTDSKGATKIEYRTVTVKENSVPVFKGVNEVTLEFGSDFNALEGITAHDKEDGDLTDKIEVEGEVNTEKAGTYTLTYKVSDSHNVTRTVERTVIVKENNAPVLNLSETSIVVEYEGSFDPFKSVNVSASDKEEGNLSSEIEIVSNNVDTNNVGNFEVVYEVSDSYGLTDTKTLSVEVKVTDEQLQNAYDEAEEAVNNVPNMEEAIFAEETGLWDVMNNTWQDHAMNLVSNEAKPMHDDFMDNVNPNFQDEVIAPVYDKYYAYNQNPTEENRKAYNEIRAKFQNDLQPFVAKAQEILDVNEAHKANYDNATADLEAVYADFKQLLTDYENTVQQASDKLERANKLYALAEKDSKIEDLQSTLKDKEASYVDVVENDNAEKRFEEIVGRAETEKEEYYSRGNQGYNIKEGIEMRVFRSSGLAGTTRNGLPAYISPDGAETYMPNDDPFGEINFINEISSEEFEQGKAEVASLVEEANNSLSESIVDTSLTDIKEAVENAKSEADVSHEAFTKASNSFHNQKDSVNEAYNNAKAISDKEVITEADVSEYNNLKSTFDSEKTTLDGLYNEATTAFDNYETLVTEVVNTVNELSTNELEGSYNNALESLNSAEQALTTLENNGALEGYYDEVLTLRETIKQAKTDIENRYQNYQTEAKSLVDVSSIQEQLEEARGIFNGLALPTYELPSQLEVTPVEEEIEEEVEETEQEEVKEEEEVVVEEVEEDSTEQSVAEEAAEVEEVVTEDVAVEETVEEVTEQQEEAAEVEKQETEVEEQQVSEDVQEEKEVTDTEETE